MQESGSGLLYLKMGLQPRCGIDRTKGIMNLSRAKAAIVLGAWAGILLIGTAFAESPTWPPPMPLEKTAPVYGLELHYYEKGKGPTVIFLHGMVGASTDWAYVLGPVSTRYHVIALDQIGFGHSAKPLIEYKIATFVDFLQEFMRVKNIAKAVIVGNSLGGWIALDFAAQHPGLVDRLVLVDAPGLDGPVHHDAPVDMNPSSRDGVRTLWEALFYDKRLATEQLVDYQWRNHLRFDDSYTIQRLVAALVRGSEFEDRKVVSVRAPTLVIWGRNDVLLPLTSAERLQKMVAGSKLILIDNCGHVPQLEKPKEFVSALLKFLNQP
jgi:pimeloyl-ACP methyl ester carboxylesterase